MISEINDKNMRLTKCNLQGIVKEIENHFEETTKSKDIKLTISCNENSKVNSSPELLYYILSNLIENSIHFRIKENPFVTIKIESKNQELHLSVSDNGIGILPEYQTKIFEMFFIGTTVSKGNGLGLYVVQKAVNRLNGKITFYSDAEHGTQFKVVIPV